MPDAEPSVMAPVSNSRAVREPEPWRYACPECGSVSIRRNVNKDSPQSNTTHDHNCHSCGAAFDEPIDKKRGSRRS